MRNLLPKESQFSRIDLEGRGAKDFAQRMFTRDFRPLQTGDGRLSLFLSADGKVQNLFWVFVEETALVLIVPTEEQKSLYELIERYHFADPFTTTPKGSVETYWEAVEDNTSGIGKKIGDDYEGLWRNTRFSFRTSSASQADSSVEDCGWKAHREKHQIPENALAYAQQLVFKVGLDELCDPGKGCYIGQEVVERVRTRDSRSTLSRQK